MRFLSFLFSKREEPKPPPAHDDYWYQTSPSFGRGLDVTPENAMQNSVVFACVRVIAETLASLPLHLYQRGKDGGKARARDNALYQLLHLQPNDFQSHFQFFEMSTAHLLLRGNSYSQILKNARGKILGLVPLNPDRMTPKFIGGEKQFLYKDLNSKIIQFPADEILHVQGLSSDGLKGISPIEQARNAIGLGIAAEAHGTEFFENDATPGGVLTHQTPLGDDAYDRLKREWSAAHGRGARHSVAILEEGMDWKSIGVTNKDAQFLELRAFQVEEIARIFRVPLHLVGDLRRATFANIEHQSLEFVTYTLLPWLKRWEEEINRTLIPANMWGEVFCEFSVDGLLRGDLKSRYEAYALGRNWGWLNVDEIREFENMNPVKDGKGEIYLQPLNMSAAGEVAPATQAPKQEAPPQDTTPKDSTPPASTTKSAQLEKVQYAFLRSTEEALDRIVRREVAEMREVSKKSTKINQLKTPETRQKTVENYRKMVKEGVESIVLAWIEAVIIGQERAVKVAGKLRNTTELAQELALNIAKSYAEESQKCLETVAASAKPALDLEDWATEHLKTRAKRHAEHWIAEIRRSVEAEIDLSERPQVVNNVQVDLKPQIVLPEPKPEPLKPEVKLKTVFRFKEDENGKHVGGESWQEPA